MSVVGDVYNAMHAEGWRWEKLTSGEQNKVHGDIEAVIDALRSLPTDKKMKAMGMVEVIGPSHYEIARPNGVWTEHDEDDIQ